MRDRCVGSGECQECGISTDCECAAGSVNVTEAVAEVCEFKVKKGGMAEAGFSADVTQGPIVN